MSEDTDNEMQIVPLNQKNIDLYRKLVKQYLNLQLYDSAAFWADKAVALSDDNPEDVYTLATCMFHLKHYHRAAHIIKNRQLHKNYIMCNYLAAKCLMKAKEHTEALDLLNCKKITDFLQASANSTPLVKKPAEEEFFLDQSPQRLKASILLLKGQLQEVFDNRSLAVESYKSALIADVYCHEAFNSLVQHQMLTAQEEEDLMKSLPIEQQCCNQTEADEIRSLYKSQLKKYHTVCSDDEQKVKTAENCAETVFANSPDVMAAQAERLYYDCQYQQSMKLTEKLLRIDPYHPNGLLVHIACLVELKLSNRLFFLAHRLVSLYPDQAIAWFAVGCYYYSTGRNDFARQYLCKSTTVDRQFGPAWLAYGHSFAVENEHDQAMAAYMKASYLMKGCHLPLLYVGLECGLSNNVCLAEKFFYQALNIAPNDPFVLHEIGVVAFQIMNYREAESRFLEALSHIKRKNINVTSKWEPLYNNLGHTCRKLKKYEEALAYHEQALVLNPQSSNTYAAIGYVKILMGDTVAAVDQFHTALGLKRDDPFSTTMLNYAMEQLEEETLPFIGAPSDVPLFFPVKASENSDITESIKKDEDIGRKSNLVSNSDMSLSF